MNLSCAFAAFMEYCTNRDKVEDDKENKENN